MSDWQSIAARVAAKWEGVAQTPKQKEILLRLTTDQRMKRVVAELTRRDRARGAFLHPARHPPDRPHRTPEDDQIAAIEEAIHFAYSAAADQRTAGKLAEVEQTRSRLLHEATVLRSVADELVASVRRYDPYDMSKIGDATALRRVADWRVALAATLRGADDPLTIEHDRGDPLARGVQINIAIFLDDRFGDHMHGTAALLAAVALGLEEPSPRVSRSALSGRS